MINNFESFLKSKYYKKVENNSSHYVCEKEKNII